MPTKILAFFLFIVFFQAHIFSSFQFQEIWTYVMKGEEKHLKGSEPITDVGYFSAVVTETGRLGPIPDLSKLPTALRSGKRIHLVISTPSNRSLMYWCLSKDKEARKNLLSDILKAAEAFDGLQIDFETMRNEEAESYLTFLKELRTRLPAEKMFSVALPAQTAAKPDPYPFNYQKIAAIADRVVIMAYDEHWRTGAPGPIASLPWCLKVFEFAKKNIAPHKLVMGIPLYGRVWQKQEVAKALKYPQTVALWKEKLLSMLERTSDGTPYFTFKETVDASVYFEDAQSLNQKISAYENQKIQAIAFWRASQEPPTLWSLLKVQTK